MTNLPNIEHQPFIVYNPDFGGTIVDVTFGPDAYDNAEKMIANFENKGEHVAELVFDNYDEGWFVALRNSSRRWTNYSPRHRKVGDFYRVWEIAKSAGVPSNTMLEVLVVAFGIDDLKSASSEVFLGQGGVNTAIAIARSW